MKIRLTRETSPSSFFVGCFILFTVTMPSAAWPQTFAQPEPATIPEPNTATPLIVTAQLDTSTPSSIPESLGDVLKLSLLQALSEEFVNDKKWGKTARRFDGFHTDGLRISKRERHVNHGVWTRYKAQLFQPEKYFQVEVQQEPGPDDQVRFFLTIQLKARCETQFAIWTYGVKGLNGTTLSDAVIRMRLVIDTKPQIKFSLSSPLPQLELSPKVTSVNLKLMDIDVKRIGVVGGDAAEIIGDASRKAIDELLKQQEKKIQQKLQHEIDAIGSRPAKKKS